MKLGAIDVYAKDPTGFIAGVWDDSKESFQVVLSVVCRSNVHPSFVSGVQCQQVSMVRVHRDFADSKMATMVYDFIGTKTVLVSDQEQHLGAKGLWKSLAKKSTKSSVYLYDAADGTFSEYDGANIPDSFIWGTTFAHKQRLLVLTDKDLSSK